VPLEPKPAAFPSIRSALKFYRVTAYITGIFLLLLVLMMVLRYGFGVDIEMGGSKGFLALTPKAEITAINLSTGILIFHGWFYVVYLVADFRLWSLMRWPLWRLFVLALGGVIPFLSFVVEHYTHREVTTYLDRREQPQEAPV
jgi:integral membrane protein